VWTPKIDSINKYLERYLVLEARINMEARFTSLVFPNGEILEFIPVS